MTVYSPSFPAHPLSLEKDLIQDESSVLFSPSLPPSLSPRPRMAVIESCLLVKRTLARIFFFSNRLNNAICAIFLHAQPAWRPFQETSKCWQQVKNSFIRNLSHKKDSGGRHVSSVHCAPTQDFVKAEAKIFFDERRVEQGR